MEPHLPKMPGEPPGEFRFPTLPIVTPDPPRRTEREKYGGLFTLGVIGLVVVCSLVAWFAWGAWSLRAVWGNVYVLHDTHRTEAERVQAAYALSRDERVNQRQYWDMCLLRSLPPLARYLLAEALTAEAVAADPRGYILSMARSTGWPVWLRLLLVRPLAYAAAADVPLPSEPLRELYLRHYDPTLDLWVEFTLAAGRPGDPAAAAALESAAHGDRPDAPLARELLAALTSRGLARTRRLDSATSLIRAHHPEAARLWAGWKIEGETLRPVH